VDWLLWFVYKGFVFRDLLIFFLDNICFLLILWFYVLF
jgi:hypothetical protein